MQQLFYERRQKEVSVSYPNQRKKERRKGHQLDIIVDQKIQSPDHDKDISPEHRRLASQIRRYDRDTFKIPVQLKIEKKEISGYTHDISPEGLLIYSDAILTLGTPLSLQFSFGENLCYLNISGQVVFCRQAETGEFYQYVIGIKFSAIRDFEQKILASAVEELRKNVITNEKSLLTILVSEDPLALEAADLSIHIPKSFEDRRPVIRRSCIHASKIIGWGSYLPDKEVTNQDISAMVKVNGNGYKNVGEVVEALTGIKSRHYADPDIYPSDLAAEAGRRALKNAGVDPMDVEVIISCGVSRDVEEPATAYIIQNKIGARNAYAFDLANACNGFVSAVDVMDSFIASGRCEIGLVTVGEVMSQYVTWELMSKKDIKLSSMGYTFGDGGGAAILHRIKNGNEEGIRARWFLSDGSYWKTAVIPLMTGRGLFKGRGSEIENLACRYIPIGVKDVIEMLEWSADDIDLVIPHQVGRHVVDLILCKKLGISSNKIAWTFPKHGNVGAASMPIAMCEALHEERVQSGDKVLFVGGSGGFSAGVVGMII